MTTGGILERADSEKTPREVVGPAVLLGAVALFTLVVLLEPLGRPGYSADRDPIAALGVGNPALALLFNATLAGLGIATAIFALRLPSGYTLERPTLVGLAAALVLAGVFPESFPFHWIFGALLYLLPAIAIWGFLFSFLRVHKGRLVWLTSGAIIVAGLGLMLTLMRGWLPGQGGTAERLIDYSGLAWGGALSAGALKDAELLIPR